MIEHKIDPRTPDEVCKQCQQFYEGDCLALQVPHSDKEKEVRSGSYGMECDPEYLKEIRFRRFQFKYHTPTGKYE